jgi:hypothetical protein
MYGSRQRAAASIATTASAVGAPVQGGAAKVLNSGPRVAQLMEQARRLNAGSAVAQLMMKAPAGGVAPAPSGGAVAASAAAAVAAAQDEAELASKGKVGPVEPTAVLKRGSIILARSQLRFSTDEIHKGGQWISREKLFLEGRASVHAICTLELSRQSANTNKFGVTVAGFHLTARSPEHVAAIKAAHASGSAAAAAVKPIATQSLHQAPGKEGATWQHGGKDAEVLKGTLGAIAGGMSQSQFSDVMNIDLGGATTALEDMKAALVGLLADNGMVLTGEVRIKTKV